MTDLDLVFIEEAFERLLLDYDRSFYLSVSYRIERDQRLSWLHCLIDNRCLQLNGNTVVLMEKDRRNL